MRYQLENKNIQLSRRMIVHMPNYGLGKTYKLGRTVIKVFSPKTEKDHFFDNETAQQLKEIPTSRILLPKKLLYVQGEFCGYSLNLVNKYGPNRKMIMQPSNNLIHNIKLLEEDIDQLSSHHVLLDGVSPKNSIYNGSLYLTDPRKFSLLDVEDIDYLNQLNQFQLHLLLSELIVSDMKRGDFSNAEVMQIRELLKIKDDQEKSSDFFSDLLEGKENIKQFVKRM